MNRDENGQTCTNDLTALIGRLAAALERHEKLAGDCSRILEALAEAAGGTVVELSLIAEATRAAVEIRISHIDIERLGVRVLGDRFSSSLTISE